MFTGLVTDIGQVKSVDDTNGLRRLRIVSRYPAESITMGASIMHEGVCLTVVDFGTEGQGSWLEVYAGPEPFSLTTLRERSIVSAGNNA
ncbi:MAG: hypothetical protein MK186_11425, partial [Henriciella sp.]|nr:hypothetical protein [Henriciella sp.]